MLVAAVPLTTDEVHVWRFSLDRRPAEVAQLRDRFIVAHAQRRILLGRYPSTAVPTLRFSYELTGKPDVAAAANEAVPQLSISHSDCAIPDPLRHEAFLACWTRKEAYIKARGEWAE